MTTTEQNWLTEYKAFRKQIEERPSDIARAEIIQCSHSTIYEDTHRNVIICTGCGLEIGSGLCLNSNHGYKTSFQTRYRRVGTDRDGAMDSYSLIKDVHAMSDVVVPPEAVELANTMFATAARAHYPLKDNIRKQLVMACLFEALKKLKLNIDNDALLEQSGLDRRGIMNGIKILNPSSSSALDADCLVHDLVTKACPANASDDRQEFLRQRTVDLIHASKKFSSEANSARPRSLAGAMLFIALEHPQKQLKAFSQTVGISEFTLNKIVRDVRRFNL